MNEVLECESKWEVDDDFVLPSMDDIIPGDEVQQSTIELTSAYFDTADRDLSAHPMRPPRAPTKPEISTPIRPVSMSVEPGGGQTHAFRAFLWHQIEVSFEAAVHHASTLGCGGRSGTG